MDTEKPDIQYVGNYKPTSSCRAFSTSFWTSEVVLNGHHRRVIDAAGMNDGKQSVVNLIPYGPQSRIADEVVSDGDLLAYIREPKQINISLSKDALLPLLKGRASHAELCYREEERARHISLWDAKNPIVPTDCRLFHDRTDNAALGIYRISLKEYDVDFQRELSLKKEVRRWKEIVRPVNFPNGFSLNMDPVDFSDMGNLAVIARKFINHSPRDPSPPVTFKMNCVQWSTLVLSLSLCFPLTRKVVSGLGVQASFETNWMSRVNGYARDGLIGLDCLPIPFYSPMEVLENALDLYLPEMKNEVLAFAKTISAESVLTALELPPGTRMDQGVIMPSAFIIENRLRKLGVPRKTKTIFEYVATALPERELTTIGQGE